MDSQTDSKQWWKSKTIIFNVVTGVVAIATSLQGDVPPNIEKVFATVIMVGNVALRFMTDKPIGSDK